MLPNIPHYAAVKERTGLEPKDIVEDYPYHIATALVYLLRAEFKHNDPAEDYQKAIDHITFEMERKSGQANNRKRNDPQAYFMESERS